MKEYIVEKHQTSGGWTWAEPKKELIRCKDCDGYDEGRCHWWYDDPDVPADGYCFQAERKEEAQNNGNV